MGADDQGFPRIELNLNQFQDLLTAFLVHLCGRFIQKQYFGIQGQQTREGNPFFSPPDNCLVWRMASPMQPKDSRDLRLCLPSLGSNFWQSGRNRPVSRHSLKKVRFLLEHADFAAEFKSLLPEGNGFIPVPHSSLIRFRQSCHHPHQAGFSCAVCPAQQCQFPCSISS